MPKLTLDAPVVGPVRIPRDTYVVRCMEEPTLHLKKDGSGARSLKFNFELVSPATKVIDGVEREIAGQQFTVYCSLENGKTSMLQALHQAAKLPLDIDIDDESGLPVGINYTGIEVPAVCSSKPVDQKNESGQPIINPADGKPLVRYDRQVERFLS